MINEIGSDFNFSHSRGLCQCVNALVSRCTTHPPALLTCSVPASTPYGPQPWKTRRSEHWSTCRETKYMEVCTTTLYMYHCSVPGTLTPSDDVRKTSSQPKICLACFNLPNPIRFKPQQIHLATTHHQVMWREIFAQQICFAILGDLFH